MKIKLHPENFNLILTPELAAVNGRVGHTAIINNKLYSCVDDATLTPDGNNVLPSTGTLKWVKSRLKSMVKEWATNVRYTVGECTLNGDFLYRCLSSHTSGTWEDDLTDDKWGLVGNRELIPTGADLTPFRGTDGETIDWIDAKPIRKRLISTTFIQGANSRNYTVPSTTFLLLMEFVWTGWTTSTQFYSVPSSRFEEVAFPDDCFVSGTNNIYNALGTISLSGTTLTVSLTTIGYKNFRTQSYYTRNNRSNYGINRIYAFYY